jgi:hypothetical protein
MADGGDLLAEVAQSNLDGTEQFAVGGIDQGIDHLLDQGQGVRQELLPEALATLVAGFTDCRDRR